MLTSSQSTSSTSTSTFTVFSPPSSSTSSLTSSSTSFLPPFPPCPSSSQRLKPPRLPRTISDMDISSESESDADPDQEITPEDLVEEGSEEEKEAGETKEEERSIDPLLAAKVASALLGSVLFTRGQIPTTIQQLAKPASRSSTPTPLPKRPSYLPSRPQPSSLLLPVLEAFNVSLQQAFRTLAALSSSPPTPSSFSSQRSTGSIEAGPTLMFLHGPSLLLPKGLFGVQLPPLASLSLDENENENETGREEARRWDTIERAVLRGLVMLRSRSSASYGSDSLGE
ncbi:hypothetical protein BDY24DRAFT_55638 [Mrakia frigida]|uniref:uncharacterized protein n=1 Tax=Mrakia frigida TaxID=29902 RepID=UPI003FCC0477